MTLAACRVFLKSWLRNLVSVQAIAAVLSSFGALWLAVEVAAFFTAGTTVPDAIRDAWPLFAIVGLLIAIGLRIPQRSVACKLNGRDVTIEISVGDIFSLHGALIVGSNTTFDTRISRELISERSVQGIFTRKYYSDETQLDAELSATLSVIAHQELKGKRVGKNKRYPIGTCVRLNPKERTGYFLAICEINEHGVASGTFDDLKESLTRLWGHIARRGSREPLLMPVLGTGYGRLTQPREEVIRETIKSFMAACSEMICAEKLTIVITPQDIARHRISLDELGLFLKHVCKYQVFSSGIQNAIGKPL